MAFVAMAINFFVTLAAYHVADKGLVYSLTGLGFYAHADSGETTCAGTPWGMLVFATAYIILMLVALFAFKNRMKQLRLLRLAGTALAIYASAYVAYALTFAMKNSLEYHSAIGLLCPLAAVVFTWLAVRGVKRDEALVRAADRIR